MTAPRKILWANRYCLLDTSGGASLSARQMLVQLKRRGWDVRILGATIFDSERGMTLLKFEIRGDRAKRGNRKAQLLGRPLDRGVRSDRAYSHPR